MCVGRCGVEADFGNRPGAGELAAVLNEQYSLAGASAEAEAEADAAPGRDGVVCVCRRRLRAQLCEG